MTSPGGHSIDALCYCLGEFRELSSIVANPVSPGVRPYALDPEHAKALWARSEELVGERF